jgi:hypothetical protein
MMRTLDMEDTLAGSKNGFTLDTCVGIKICDIPNLGNLLACRLNFKDSEIHFCSQMISESKNNYYDINLISKKITSSTGANVVFGSITDDMENDAEYLLALCETLHAGDSQILAYARATKTTLITCDKGLAAAAKFCGVNVVNPDTLPCDQITKKVKKSKFNLTVKNIISKPLRVQNKVKSFTLKPGQKIIWRTFN